MSFTSPASRWGDVYLATGARAVSACGDFAAAVALVLALQARGAGGFAVAAVLLGAAVPPAVLAPVCGRLVDRLDSRLLLCVTATLQALACAALAYTANTGLMLALIALLGVGLAITQPTFAALLPSMVKPTDLPRATALGQTANMVGMLVAPALAGVLVGRFGLRVPLLLDAASYLALAAAGLAIRTRRSRQGATRHASGEARWSPRGDRLVWWQMVITGAVIAVVGAVNVVEVFFVRGTLHASATMFGIIGAAWVVGMLAGAWLLARRRLGDAGLARVTVTLLAAITVVGLVAAAVPGAGWMLPLWVLGGMCNGGLNVAMTVQLGRRVPERARGRAFAIFGGIVNGGNVIGYLLGGALLGIASPRAVLATTEAAGLLVVVTFALPVLRAIRREGTVDNHERTATSPGRPHPVPELPSDLLGTDAVGRAA